MAADVASIRSKMVELQEKRSLLDEKIKISRRIVRDEKRRYNIGKIELDRLIEIETELLRYQFKKQAEELEFGKTILQWLALNDQLLLLKDRF